MIMWLVPCTPPGGPVPTRVGMGGAPECAGPASTSRPPLRSSGRPSPLPEGQVQKVPRSHLIWGFRLHSIRENFARSGRAGPPALGLVETSPSRAVLSIPGPVHRPQ